MRSGKMIFVLFVQTLLAMQSSAHICTSTVHASGEISDGIEKRITSIDRVEQMVKSVRESYEGNQSGHLMRV